MARAKLPALSSAAFRRPGYARRRKNLKILDFHQEAERLGAARLTAGREKEAELQRAVFRMR
jgi:hypothetical protein